MPDILHRGGARGEGGVRKIRCAIYTRKSSDEGLEQEFNSLHAQREACEAYVASQRHESWIALATEYDDGGFSGGSMQRPALERLLADISAARVDVVVVYKIDRLTRSLFDFAKIVEILEKANASFVSVTQSFNTTTSMGRLTLNVLLSFAQFEREVAGERIRDKIAASRARGMFMGGNIPIGYDLKDHALVINETEATLVQRLFKACSNGCSIADLKQQLDEEGQTTKRRKASGGKPFTTGHLYWILRNPVYIGKTRHKGTIHEGRHQPIITEELWNKVQEKLDARPGRRGAKTTTRSPNLLNGLLTDAKGNTYTATSAKKGNRRYRYYVRAKANPNTTENHTIETDSLRRIPAQHLDALVIEALVNEFRDAQRMHEGLTALGIAVLDQAPLIEQANKLASTLAAHQSPETREQVRELIRAIVVDDGEIAIKIEPDKLMVMLGQADWGTGNEAGDERAVDERAADERAVDWSIRVPFALPRTRRHRKAILTSATVSTSAEPDPTLINAILRARRWFDSLVNGTASSISALAESENTNRAWISAQLPLAFLAPDITESILDGRQPKNMTAKDLAAIAGSSVDWNDQRAVFAEIRRVD